MEILEICLLEMKGQGKCCATDTPFLYHPSQNPIMASHVWGSIKNRMKNVKIVCKDRIFNGNRVKNSDFIGGCTNHGPEIFRENLEAKLDKCIEKDDFSLFSNEKSVKI